MLDFDPAPPRNCEPSPPPPPPPPGTTLVNCSPQQCFCVATAHDQPVIKSYRCFWSDGSDSMLFAPLMADVWQDLALTPNGQPGFPGNEGLDELPSAIIGSSQINVLYQDGEQVQLGPCEPTGVGQVDLSEISEKLADICDLLETQINSDC